MWRREVQEIGLGCGKRHRWQVVVAVCIDGIKR